MDVIHQLALRVGSRTGLAKAARKPSRLHTRVINSLMLMTAALALPAAASPPWQPADGETIQFDIIDGSTPAGQMVVRFSRPDAATLLVNRRQELTIKRMMLSATLVQTSQERWVGGTFVELVSDTSLTTPIKDTQNSLTVSRSSDGSLAGKSSSKHFAALPADALPMTLWRGDLQDGAYFDVNDGQLLRFTVKPLGPKDLPPASSNAQACRGQDVSIAAAGKTSRLLLWSDQAGRICALRMLTDAGAVDYVASTAQDGDAH